MLECSPQGERTTIMMIVADDKKSEGTDMAMTSTQMVMDHMAAHVSKNMIGDIYMRDHTGNLQLWKKGCRILRKNYGHTYWQAGTVHVPVQRFQKGKYEVRLSDV